jgi:hypothetical protein
MTFEELSKPDHAMWQICKWHAAGHPKCFEVGHPGHPGHPPTSPIPEASTSVMFVLGLTLISLWLLKRRS